MSDIFDRLIDIFDKLSIQFDKLSMQFDKLSIQFDKLSMCGNELSICGNELSICGGWDQSPSIYIDYGKTIYETNFIILKIKRPDTLTGIGSFLKRPIKFIKEFI